MSKTYNKIGSLTTLKLHLKERNIDDFKSLKEVMDFQSSYTTLRQELILHHENLIEQEKNTLKAELQSLDNLIDIQRQQAERILKDEINELKRQLSRLTNQTQTNFFHRLAGDFRHWNYKRKIQLKEQGFDNNVRNSISRLVDSYNVKSNRYQFISSNTGDAVTESVKYPLSELERKKGAVDRLNSFIYGALGEQKVVKTLENLSDEYYLINDFDISFSSAIYNRQGNDYIKSVQIDHILVGPSGIFLIETKNWSKKSLENVSLHSPVQQIRRTSFVLFKLLNNEMSNDHLCFDRHHWGDRKIPIKNLIVFTGTKPKEEFQYVKILTLNELLGYVNYFTRTFSGDETKRIADFILRINEQKVIQTR